MIELIVIGLYFLAVIAIGLRSHRKHWRLDDYLVAGRKYSISSLPVRFWLPSLAVRLPSAWPDWDSAGDLAAPGGCWWAVSGLIVLGHFFARQGQELTESTLCRS